MHRARGYVASSLEMKVAGGLRSGNAGQEQWKNKTRLHRFPKNHCTPIACIAQGKYSLTICAGVYGARDLRAHGQTSEKPATVAGHRQSGIRPACPTIVALEDEGPAIIHRPQIHPIGVCRVDCQPRQIAAVVQKRQPGARQIPACSRVVTFEYAPARSPRRHRIQDAGV